MQPIYDPETDTITLYWGLGTVKTSDEVAPGIILDYDHRGEITGVEILNASKKLELGQNKPNSMVWNYITEPARPEMEEWVLLWVNNTFVKAQFYKSGYHIPDDTWWRTEAGDVYYEFACPQSPLAWMRISSPREDIQSPGATPP